MNNQLKALYKELLSIQMKDGRTIYDRITPSDLCLAGHRVGRLYDGLLIYGQAMNGWQNGENLSIDALIDEIEAGASDYKELYTMVDYNGWHSYTNGKPAKYHYKRSKFWKLNYLVITNAQTQATVLKVATLEYLPYCFFNLLSPLMSIFIAAIGFKIVRKSK